MKAGRELDAEVSEKVMGRPVTWLKTALSERDPHVVRPEHSKGYVRCPSYSTDIRDAWEVVEKMRAAWTVTLMTYGATVCCELEQGDSNDPDPAKYGRDRQPYRWAEEMAATAPLAICRAALRVVGIR